jgi:CxxC-x17-CxxC domain-containing protein
MNENDITFFGITNFRNEKKKFGIKRDDRRRHFYAIGKSGAGKTEMLKNMIVQDIARGDGVGFIDPHGEAAQSILDYIPENRINDVVYFNPADLDMAIGFNVMESVDKEYHHLVASGLMGVFKKIWPDVWSARMEYILNNTILALLEYPNSTLLGINRMLSDAEFRKKVIDNVTDPVVKAFWIKEFSSWSKQYATEAVSAIQNKVGQFTSVPLVRNIIGQVNSTINMREIMDNRKIFIVNLSKGKIGEDNSMLLGALVITKLQLAAMERVNTPEEERKDFFLYIDEFQNFATRSFVNILSEARKYRLALILSHQYIGQLQEYDKPGHYMRDAIFGNVGTIVSFRVGAEDAEFLEKEFAPNVIIEDIVNLSNYNIYVKLLIDGIAGRPFSAATFPLESSQKIGTAEKIIRISGERYGTKREKVEEKLSRWLEDFKKEAEKAEVVTNGQNDETREVYDAECSMCGKKTKVPFPPDGTRPTYCKTCRKKIQREKEETKAKKGLSLKEALEEAKGDTKEEGHLSNLKKVLKEVFSKKQK